MSDFFALAMSADFAKRGDCGNWHPWFVWLYVLSNILIFSAYMAIPLVLGAAMFRKRSFEPIYISRRQATWMRLAFAAFIFSCGIGHLEGALSFFSPRYHLYALWHFITAAFSWAAVFAVVKLRHRIIPGI